MPKHTLHKTQRYRNYLVLAVLIFLMIALYNLSMARFGGL